MSCKKEEENDIEPKGTSKTMRGKIKGKLERDQVVHLQG
jgi:hypothetical protein